MLFQLNKSDAKTQARACTLTLPHGTVQTPVFMPVGTQGTLKGCLPDAVEKLGAQIILSNTYHLMLRPTTERLEKLGGLHSLMKWNKPILTDSGGFQVFSLAKLAKIDEGGVSFQSHLDGANMRLTPESVMEAQRQIGSDIAMVLDVCPAGTATEKEVEEAVKMTLKWAKQAKNFISGAVPFSPANAAKSGAVPASQTLSSDPAPAGEPVEGPDANKPMDSKSRPHNVFGIVQGGRFSHLREACAKELVALDFDGYAIGGVAVGEEESEILKQTKFTAPLLPVNKPRYAMGIGNPVQLLEMVGHGIDMFDCVIPTREARHGVAYTNHGKINIKNEKWKEDLTPLDETIISPASTFSKAYIRHLIVAEELLGLILLTYHNIAFFVNLMADARKAILAGNFTEWKTEWTRGYCASCEKV